MKYFLNDEICIDGHVYNRNDIDKIMRDFKGKSAINPFIKSTASYEILGKHTYEDNEEPVSIIVEYNDSTKQIIDIITIVSNTSPYLAAMSRNYTASSIPGLNIAEFIISDTKKVAIAKNYVLYMWDVIKE